MNNSVTHIEQFHVAVELMFKVTQSQPLEMRNQFLWQPVWECGGMTD